MLGPLQLWPCAISQRSRGALPGKRLSGMRIALLTLTGAALLLLPAFLFGRPWVYWDTPTFYGWGHDIVEAIRHPWPSLDHFPSNRGLWAADVMPGAADRITPDQFQLMFTQIGARSKFYAVPL